MSSAAIFSPSSGIQIVSSAVDNTNPIVGAPTDRYHHQRLHQQQQQRQQSSSSSVPLMLAAPAVDNSLCQRVERRCSRPKLDGYKFCIQHHLPPTTTTTADGVYRRCTYVSSRSGLRCARIVHRSDTGRECLCGTHARMIALMRRRAAIRDRHRDSIESIVDTMRHYRSFASDQSTIPTPTPPVVAGSTKKPTAVRTRVQLDYASESSDEDETAVGIDECEQYVDDQVCDTVVDDRLDPLRNAGVFTAEEIVTIARDRLIRLHALHFQYVTLLKEKYRLRRAFYRKRIEEETKNGPYTAVDYQQYKRLAQLKAMRRYHRKKGPTAVMRRRRKLNQLAGDVFYSADTCIHDVSGVKCSNAALPKMKFCLKHVLQDTKQCLFGKCAHLACTSTIPVYLIGGMCWMHRAIPPKLEETMPPVEMTPPPTTIAAEATMAVVKNDTLLDAGLMSESKNNVDMMEGSNNFSQIMEQVASGALLHDSV